MHVRSRPALADFVARRTRLTAAAGHRVLARLSARIVLAVACCVPLIAAAADYFPVPPTAVWSLKASGVATRVTLEALSYGYGATTLRFTTPWSSDLWQVVPQGGQVILTGYGSGDALAAIPGNEVFFDFNLPAGASWTSAVGQMVVLSKGTSFKAGSKTYRNVIRLQQTAGTVAFIYTFAPDVGLVGFEVGKYKFVLDASNSRYTLSRHPLARTGFVPSPTMLVGTTLNTFANDNSTENLLNNYATAIGAGMNYVSGAGLWTDVEIGPGVYNFDSVDFMVSESRRYGLEGSYTLRAVDTLFRRLPSDLQQLRWSDPAVEQRALALVDALVTRFDGTVKWFMFGNEIDSYFVNHPDEIQDFAALFAKLRARAKQLAPDMAFSTSVSFANEDVTVTTLAPIDAYCDVLALTYYPLFPDFTVEDPSVPARDFARMRLLARGRGVLLQEIGYPSGAANASSPQQQADFYTNTFAAMRANRDLVDAGNFFVFADFSDEFALALSSYYGVADSPAFTSFLQTLGMFDGSGNAKPNWYVFTTEMSR